VFAGPRADAISMGAFRGELDGGPLAFERRDGAFWDAQTGSRWTIEGEAVEGELLGARLAPVRSFYVRWHAWAGWHPTTSLFRSDREPPTYERRTVDVTASEVDPLLGALASRGVRIRIAGPIPSQRRPRRSRSSLSVALDGDPFVVHAFSSQAAARDHEELRGAWSALPLRPRVLETRVRRIGRFVLDAAPENRFADPAQVVPRPWSKLSWPGLLDGPILDEVASEIAPVSDPEPEVGLTELVRALRVAGFDVVDVGFLPPGQLRVGALDALALTVDADRLLLYLFEDETAAARYAATEAHARAFGRFVIRSTPDTMYVHQLYEILYAGDDRISWSPLLTDPRFADVIGEAVGRGSDLKPEPGAADVA
jgi:hypothetical protein